MPRCSLAASNFGVLPPICFVALRWDFLRHAWPFFWAIMSKSCGNLFLCQSALNPRMSFWWIDVEQSLCTTVFYALRNHLAWTRQLTRGMRPTCTTHFGRDVIPSICFSMKWVDLNGNQRKADCERPAGGFRQWLAAIHVPIFIDDRPVKDINARFRLSLDINVIQRVSENRPQEFRVSFLEQPDHNVHSLPQYYRNLCQASTSGSKSVVEIFVWGRHPLCTHRWMTAVLLARFRPFCMWIFIQCCSWEFAVLLFKTFLRESQMVELFRDPPYPQSKDPQSNFFPAFEASPIQKSGKDFCAELMHSTLAFWWYWIEFYFCSKIEASALRKVSGHLLLVFFFKKKII